MLRGRIQHPSLRRIPDSLATSRAEPLMRGMRDKLLPAGMARTNAERLPTIGQTCTPIPALATEPPIPMHRPEKLAATLTRPITVHSDLGGRKIHGGGRETGGH
jgi:hypothetical protein